MDNKILIEVFVPIIDQKYELFIPINKTVSEVTDYLKKLINELSNDYYQIEEDDRLYNREDGSLYELNKTIKETNIRNASKIVLV